VATWAHRSCELLCERVLAVAEALPKQPLDPISRRVISDRPSVSPARGGHGRVVLGRWVHIGDGTQLRAHEGTLRVGDKVVIGQYTTVNCYLDVEIGARTLIADWIYIADFDHRIDDLERPIKDQGIVKSPVRIGPDCWLGVKATVLRGSVIGSGSVVAAHAVVRGVVPRRVVVGGVPARVIKSRVNK
jgi:acetyltransferase-like isoleucine patch superfamily enzyme